MDETGSGESTRRQRTRERLIDAAYEVFAEQGVHAAAIETIVERAGFTRGAFYSNFESKEELFFALAERETTTRIDRLERGAQEMLQAPDGASAVLDQDDVAAIVGSFLELQNDDRRWCLVDGEFRQLALRDPEVAERYLENERMFVGRLADFLKDAVAQLGLEFVMDVADVTRLVVGVYSSAIQEAILEGSEDEDRAAHAIAMRTLPPLIHNLTRPARP